MKSSLREFVLTSNMTKKEILKMIKPKIVTTDDLFNALPKERQERINAEVERTVAKWGGARSNSGRKTKDPSKVLKFTKRLTEKENDFTNYARAHNLNYDDLMQG